MTETEWIDKIKQGDNESFRLLVKQFENVVMKTCYHFVGNAADAEDLTQDVFVEVFRSAGGFRGESSVSTWIYRIAVNKSLNFIRKAQRRKIFGSIESLLGGRWLQTHSEPAVSQNTLETDEENKILYQTINNLPENQKVAFTLHKFDDLSYREIADVMQISVSAVESLIFRAKSNLQKKLWNYFKKN